MNESIAFRPLRRLASFAMFAFDTELSELRRALIVDGWNVKVDIKWVSEHLLWEKETPPGTWMRAVDCD